jgi:hypothetical protein
MAEVLGILTGAVAAIEQSISLFNTIKNAVNSVRDLPKVIDKHTKELKRIKDLVNLIQAEQALRTLAVGAAAEHVQDGAEKLRQRLELLKKHSETSKVEQVIRAFISGSNESKVEKIMKELVEAKLGLVANMLVVNVGLTQGVDKSLKVNTATIQRVNDLIQERLGDNTKSLKLAERMKGRAANGEGAVDLTVDDIKFLRDNTPAVDVSTSPLLSQKVESLRAKKVIKGNLSTDQAWMQNVPVTEVDDWKDCDVFILNNTAEGDSVMQNHPLPQDVLLKMFEIRYGGKSER